MQPRKPTQEIRPNATAIQPQMAERIPVVMAMAISGLMGRLFSWLRKKGSLPAAIRAASGGRIVCDLHHPFQLGNTLALAKKIHW
ncbi:hypothetical protein CF111_19090 [Aeromonas sobria]|nr:hypothetical protein CF111_19090 [Aeromonas sobria]